MITTRVTIQFTSLTNLWAFRMAINVNIFEMNMSELTITCKCSEEHIRLALDEYKGRLIETKKQEA
jgi:hypothetical protein